MILIKLPTEDIYKGEKWSKDLNKGWEDEKADEEQLRREGEH